jgi:hypothetical protein
MEPIRFPGESAESRRARVLRDRVDHLRDAGQRIITAADLLAPGWPHATARLFAATRKPCRSGAFVGAGGGTRTPDTRL